MVAPPVGAWIEIFFWFLSLRMISSLPPWERGLKSGIATKVDRNVFVAPPVGAWIEIVSLITIIDPSGVAPPVGAWIEIGVSDMREILFKASLPPWERGLKYHFSRRIPHPTESLPSRKVN